MNDNNLIEKIAKYVERDHNEISNLVASMSYHDLVLISSALRRGDEKAIYTILHGYGI